jgi:SAM-dependent methyltransferase
MRWEKATQSTFVIVVYTSSYCDVERFATSRRRKRSTTAGNQNPFIQEKRSMAITIKAVLAASFLTMASASAWAQSNAEYKPKVGQGGKDVVWVPTPQTVVDAMLDIAELTPKDTLVDLGSGDGRTVITAAKRGASARGIEYNPDLVALSLRNAEKEGLKDKVVFEEADIFESDFSEATVVTLFLLPELNVRLRPTILDMEPGTRVIANSFTMDDWQPDGTAHVTDDCTSYCYVYKWVVPARVSGTWNMAGKHLTITQNYQEVAGSLHEGDSSVHITQGRLDGKKISFTVDGAEYVGEVNGTTMTGKVNGGADWKATFGQTVTER